MKVILTIIICFIMQTSSSAQHVVSFSDGSSRLSDLSQETISKMDSAVYEMRKDSLNSEIWFIGSSNSKEWTNFRAGASDALNTAKSLGRAQVVRNRYGFGVLDISSADTAGVTIVTKPISLLNNLRILNEERSIATQIANPLDTETIEKDTLLVHSPAVNLRVGVGGLLFIGRTDFVLPVIRLSLVGQNTYGIYAGIDFAGKGCLAVSYGDDLYSVSLIRLWKYIYGTDYWTNRVTGIQIQRRIKFLWTGIHISKEDTLFDSRNVFGISAMIILEK